MKTRNFIVLSSLVAGIALAQEKPAAADAINGVRGVKQEAVTSIKKIAPPTVVPVTPPPPKGLTQPVPPPPPTGITQSPPPPPPAMQGVNKVDGIHVTPPNTVKGVPPEPAAAISTIRAVQGVQGIIAPKQMNLEAALLIKEDAKGTPAGGGAEGGKGKAAAAAAALLNGPKGLAPAPPAPDGDGRAGLQEFEKLDKPGS